MPASSISTWPPSSIGTRWAALSARRKAAGASLLALLVAGPLAVTALMVADPGSVSLAPVKSVLAMLSDRSPGQRGVAELTKTKKRIAAAPRPTQRALGKIHRPALPTEVVDALLPKEFQLAQAAPPIPPVVAANPLVEESSLLAPGLVMPAANPIVGGIPGGGPSAPGGGGPGGPGSPGVTPVAPGIDNPPSAVPEPATWLSMLLGFGFIGWGARRRRTVTVCLAS